MPTITPFLWFDDNAEQAAELYTSIFPEASIISISRYGEGGPAPAGTAMTVNFWLQGLEFTALNGGPQYRFTEAISFVVPCETQEEVDEYWAKLSEGGEEGPCGWRKDRFGLSWQIVPSILEELLASPDPVKAQNAMKAMLQMSKLDIEGLKRAASEHTAVEADAIR